MKPIIVVLAVAAIVSGCGSGEEAGAPSSETCARPGQDPVTVARLVEVFQKHGITLEINQRACEFPKSYRADATNGGPLGIERDPEVWRREGDINCHLGTASDESEGTKVRREHFEGEKGTTLYVLNVACSVRPSDGATAEQQIAQVEQALDALARGST